MENKKAVLITIVVLLFIFTPLTVMGAFFKANVNPLEENPSHDFYYKGSLWFYDTYDKLMSTYKCLTETCEFTKPVIDDSNYGVKYYQDGSLDKLWIIDDKYTFITDGVTVYLFNVESGRPLQSYKAVKNYNVKLENNTFIIQNNKDLWGVLTVGNNLGSVLPFEYDFIGLKEKEIVNGTFPVTEFIVEKDSKWYLVDLKNSSLTAEIPTPIIDYNNQYLFSKSNDRIRIYSYDGTEHLLNYRIKDYVIADDYYGIITDSFLIVYHNLEDNYLKFIPLTREATDITLEKDNNKLVVKFNGNIVDNIAIS